MSKGPAIPTLGYPTRYEAAAALNAQGLKPCEIAGRIGTTTDAVHTLLSYAKLSVEERRKAKRQAWRASARTSVVLSKRVTAALQEDAEARGLSVAALSRRLIAAIVADGLVDAILDDAPEQAEAAE